jgi:hypothetical protein
MPFGVCVLEQVKLLEQGKLLEVVDRFFDKDAVMYSNSVLLAEGFLRCRQMQEPFLAAATNIRAEITDVFLDSTKQLSIFRNLTKFDGPDGAERQITGIHIQKWRGERIVCEWYCNGEPMTDLLAKGVLNNPSLGCTPKAR